MTTNKVIMNKEYFSSINEVSTKLELPAHTLRYWEKQFPTLIKPTTGAGGRRYYRGDTVGALVTIKDLLYNRGMTIAGVKKMIKEGGCLTPLAGGVVHSTKGGVTPPVRFADSPPASGGAQANIHHAISLLEQALVALQ